MRAIVLLAGLALSGCGGAEAGRWIGAENKIITIDDIPYQVSWVRDASGIDMRGVRAQPVVIMPDAMIERRRNTEAAMIVGAGLCGSKASVVAEMKDGDLYGTRIKCG
jgi:hypothetical protein